MPIYEFHHILPLTKVQKSTLAGLVTDWHATTFKAPRFIVNCRFIDNCSARDEDNWVGGLPMTANKLSITLRSGTNRTAHQYEIMTKKMASVWDEAVKDIPGDKATKELKDIFIMGSVDSAFERGFQLPMPGHFEEWVIKNKSNFQKEADEGDKIFQKLMEEIEDRSEFQPLK